jgi:hypothetical protein
VPSSAQADRSNRDTVKRTIDELGIDSFRPGDVVMHNDPVAAVALCRSRPIFLGGEISVALLLL